MTLGVATYARVGKNGSDGFFLGHGTTSATTPGNRISTNETGNFASRHSRAVSDAVDVAAAIGYSARANTEALFVLYPFGWYGRSLPEQGDPLGGRNKD